MSFLDFLGGAAGAGEGILARQIQNQDQLASSKTLAEFNSDLALQRENTIAELKRTRDKTDASQIQADAGQARADRILKAANSGGVDPLAPPSATQNYLLSDPAQDAGPYSGLQVTGGDTSGLMPANMAPSVNVASPGIIAMAADAATPRKTYTADDVSSMTPEQLQKLGIKDDRAAHYDDLAAAAEATGRGDMAKEYRGQQQIELQRAGQEAQARRADAIEQLKWTTEQRRQASDDQRWANEAEKRDNDARRADIAQQRVEAMIARLGRAGSNHPAKDALQFITEQRKALANESTEASQVFQRMVDPAVTPKASDRAELAASYRTKMDDLSKRRRTIDADYNAVREKVGLGPAPADTPAPTPSPDAQPAGLPPGSVKIGTSGGKAVWQTPDGRKLIEQ